MKVKSFITLTLELQLPMMTSSHFRRIRFRQVRCRLKRRQFGPPSNKKKHHFWKTLIDFRKPKVHVFVSIYFTIFGT